MLDQNTDRMWYVIGALVVGAGIILLANKAMPQVFASVADTFSAQADEARMTIAVQLATDGAMLHKDTELTYAEDTSMYQARAGTSMVVDMDAITVSGAPSLRIKYDSGSNGTRTGTNDFILWFSMPATKAIQEGDILEVSFYAKSDQAVQLGTQLGAMFEGSFKQTIVTTEWSEVTWHIPVAFFEGHVANPVEGAVVFWVDKPSTVWISDLEVHVHSVGEQSE